MFRDGNLGLDNLSRDLSLENTGFLTFSLSQFHPVALHGGVGPCESSPIHIGLSIGSVILQVLFRQPYRWHRPGVASLSYIKVTISQQMSLSFGSYKVSDAPSSVLFSVFEDVILISIVNGFIYSPTLVIVCFLIGCGEMESQCSLSLHFCGG